MGVGEMQRNLPGEVQFAAATKAPLPCGCSFSAFFDTETESYLSSPLFPRVNSVCMCVPVPVSVCEELHSCFLNGNNDVIRT